MLKRSNGTRGLNRCAYPVMLTAGLGILATSALCQSHEDDAPEQSRDGVTQSTRKVQTQREAIDHVLAMLGAPRQLASNATARLATVQTDNTPFLHEQVVGRQLWEVVVPQWRIELASAKPGVADAYERTFDVLLDPESGNVLWIASRWPDGEPGKMEDLPAKIAEEQMKGWWGEEYHSFPTAKPSTTFAQAMDVVLAKGRGNPLVAKRITGRYVIQSSGGREPTAMWAITLQGIRRIAPGAPGDARPRYSRQMRHLVDATTGAWVHSVNFPKPISGGDSSLRRGAPGIDTATVTLDLTSPSDTLVLTPLDEVEWTITATVSPGNNLGLALLVVDLVQDSVNNPAIFAIPPGTTPLNMQHFARPYGISNPAPNGFGSAYGGTPSLGAGDLLQIGGAQNILGVPGVEMGLEVIVEEEVGQLGGRVIATGSFLAPCTDGLYMFSIESGVANVLAEVNPAPDSSLARSADVIYGSDSFSFTVDMASGQLPPEHRYYVAASAVGDNDGTTWANAFRNLQDALSLAKNIPSDSHEIWVAAGTYYPDRDGLSPNGDGDTTASFDLLNKVSIYGGFLGIAETQLIDRNPEDNSTILTGELTPGYYFPDCGNPTAGPCDSVHSAPGCEDAECCKTVCRVMPECCDPQGSGWDLDCVDFAEAGLCEYCGDPNAGPCDEANGTPGCEDAECCALVCALNGFDQCCTLAWDAVCLTIVSTVCTPPTPAQAGTIVRATSVDGTAVLNGFTISGSGGGFEGGGILIDDASPRIVRCTLTDNHVVCDFDDFEAEPGNGGAMHIRGNSNPTLINCSFIANTACEGAALHTEATGNDIAEATLINCLFAGNTSETHGGAIDAGGFYGADLRIINCTFVDNIASDGGASDDGGGAIWNHRGGTVTITNSILWNNYPDEIRIPAGDPSPVVVSFSDVEGGVLGEGNIDIDPSFCDPGAGVFGLRPDSPCLDAGSDAAVPFDFADLNDDLEPCEPLPWDLSALPRFFDALASTSDVDMGAYESQVSPMTCPMDCGNDDGDVGIRDFLELLAQWGSPGSCDFNGGGVGITDFLFLLANWGPCPNTVCVVSLTIQQELALHCLDQADWDLHEAVMTDPASSQLKKNRYDCWMRHYLDDCDYCSCSTALCPGKDPFR